MSKASGTHESKASRRAAMKTAAFKKIDDTTAQMDEDINKIRSVRQMLRPNNNGQQPSNESTESNQDDTGEFDTNPGNV